MNKPNEKWYRIPGFPDYEVSNLYEVRKADGKMLKRRNKEYFLRRDKRTYTLSAPRLLYAALHEVDPSELKRVLVVDVKGELTLMTRPEYIMYVNTRLKSPGLGKETAKEYYKRSIRFAQMVLSYYETDDISEIAGELLKYEDRIKAYMREYRYSTCDEIVDEAWSSILANVLSYISRGNASIIEPYNYLRRSVKTYFSVMRQCEKKKVRLDKIEGWFESE